MGKQLQVTMAREQDELAYNIYRQAEAVDGPKGVEVFAIGLEHMAKMVRRSGQVPKNMNLEWQPHQVVITAVV